MRAIAAAIAALSLATGAAAQDNDLFAGYSMLVADGETLHGWHAAAGFRLSGRLGLAADASGHYGTAEGGEDLSVLALMAGPRFTFAAGRTRPFVHVLAGVARTRASITPIEGVVVSRSSTDFGAAFGGGLDIGFATRWAARLGADYRVVWTDGDTADDPRFSAGIVYRFGR
jgi:opacity protein-like surface antigen